MSLLVRPRVNKAALADFPYHPAGCHGPVIVSFLVLLRLPIMPGASFPLPNTVTETEPFFN